MFKEQVLQQHDTKPIFAFVVNFYKEKRKMKNKKLLSFFVHLILCAPFKHLPYSKKLITPTLPMFVQLKRTTSV